ncbi:MAG TPA: carboxypeptidase-like regulatory domain-containing protein, partial [Thermoanaerobaculia bacterium]|nr:carboxypeptidase-like regulatory domain-containing protein [Thermoanaerobaculia bacterium]
VILKSAADPSLVRRVAFEGNTARSTEAAGSEWEVTLDANGFWAAPQRVVFPGDGAERRETLDVWRTGHIRLKLASIDPAPADVRLGLASSPDRRAKAEVPRGTSFPCVKDGAAWTCEIPATTLDVAVHTPGFAPHYRWDVNVAAGATHDLGTITLKKGASLVAWLAGETLHDVKGPVRATLRHHVTRDPSRNTARLAAPVAEATFTKKGMVQLAPLPAGRYILEATAAGFAPTRIPVEVSEGREAVLRRAIELSRAVTARLRFDPARAPDGTPWQVDLWRRVDFGSGWERATSGTAAGDGTFEGRDQAEGPVRLVLRDSRRNVLATRELTLVQGDAEQLVTLEIATLAGTVTIGDEALPNATLQFGGSGGSEKVHVKADDTGKFEIVLPRRGQWTVDVDAPDASVAASVRVDVPADASEIEIELPSTEITGWVNGPGGERVAGADVELMLEKGVRRRPTGSDGTFRFRGVQSGAVRIRASDPRTRGYSRIVEVRVAEEGLTPNVALTIESLREVKGVVRSNGSAVVGARVNGYAFAGGAAQQERATTDVHGAFALQAPESAPEMILVVGAPGRPLHGFTLSVPQDAAVLELPARGGSLHLRWPAEARPVRLLFNEMMIPISDLLDWARAHGEQFRDNAVRVPNVGAGRYRLCIKDHCADGILAAGGQLELDLVTARPARNAGGV